MGTTTILTEGTGAIADNGVQGGRGGQLRLATARQTSSVDDGERRRGGGGVVVVDTAGGTQWATACFEVVNSSSTTTIGAIGDPATILHGGDGGHCHRLGASGRHHALRHGIRQLERPHADLLSIARTNRLGDHRRRQRRLVVVEDVFRGSTVPVEASFYLIDSRHVSGVCVCVCVQFLST